MSQNKRVSHVEKSFIVPKQFGWDAFLSKADEIPEGQSTGFLLNTLVSKDLAEFESAIKNPGTTFIPKAQPEEFSIKFPQLEKSKDGYQSKEPLVDPITSENMTPEMPVFFVVTKEESASSKPALIVEMYDEGGMAGFFDGKTYTMRTKDIVRRPLMGIVLPTDSNALRGFLPSSEWKCKSALTDRMLNAVWGQKNTVLRWFGDFPKLEWSALNPDVNTRCQLAELNLLGIEHLLGTYNAALEDHQSFSDLRKGLKFLTVVPKDIILSSHEINIRKALESIRNAIDYFSLKGDDVMQMVVGQLKAIMNTTCFPETVLSKMEITMRDVTYTRHVHEPGKDEPEEKTTVYFGPCPVFDEWAIDDRFSEKERWPMLMLHGIDRSKIEEICWLLLVRSVDPYFEFSLKDLNGISIAYSDLTALPNCLRLFKEVKVLELSFNKSLEALPDWLGDFTELLDLWVRETGIKELPAQTAEQFTQRYDEYIKSLETSACPKSSPC